MQLNSLLVYLSDHCRCLFFLIAVQFSNMFYLTETSNNRANMIDFLFPEETAKMLSMLSWYIGGWVVGGYSLQHYTIPFHTYRELRFKQVVSIVCIYHSAMLLFFIKKLAF